jgi:hypothetical protein
LSAKGCQKDFITRAILQPLYPLKTLPLLHQNYNYLIDKPIKFTFTLCLNGYQIYFHQNKKEDNTDCMNKFLIVGLET